VNELTVRAPTILRIFNDKLQELQVIKTAASMSVKMHDANIPGRISIDHVDEVFLTYPGPTNALQL